MVKLNEPPVGTTERHVKSENATLVSWCPGDGFKYTLLACELGSEVCESMGAQPGSLWVSLGFYGNGFQSYPLKPGQVKALRYMREKFDFSEREAVAFTVLVNFALCEPGSASWELADEMFREMVTR